MSNHATKTCSTADDEDEADEELMTAGLPFNHPSLMYPKSDTHIMRLRRNVQAFRKVSPPRMVTEEALTAPASLEPVARQSSVGSTSDGECALSKKKHISFNVFVE